MAAVRSVWFLLLLGLSVPVAFCRRDYQQYYMNKYHKGTSTTVAPITDTSDVSSTENIPSSPEESSTEESISPSLGGSQEEGRHENETVLHGDLYGNSYDDQIQYVFIVRIVMIVGSVIFFVCVLGCVICCCPQCCRGRERRGFIIRTNREDTATEVHPQQPLVTQPEQQPVLSQHFPPNYTQEQAQMFPAPYSQQPVQQFPPQYQSALHQSQFPAVQPQNQYSPTTLQFYNPPEAPPPYEDTPPHKY